VTAPTTAEVREALAKAERDDARASRSYSGGGDTAPGHELALEVAEHRDALAAEVETLRADVEMFQQGASVAEQTRRDLAAEVARVRKLFDDAGLGEYDILGLVDHYQAEAMRMSAEVARLREALEIACNWWGGCGHHADDCPGVADECKAAKRVNELAAKGAGR